MADGAGNNFDIVILGGGSGGYACALRAVQLGKSVALIEKSKLGGTCLHCGCIPTKALLHSAEVADRAREGEKFGIKSTFDGIDMAAVNAYKDGVIDRLYKGLQGLIKSGGITVVEGEGKLVDPKTVEVNGERYTGTNVVLATGSVSRTLGLEIGGRVITSYRGAHDDRGAREGRHHRRQRHRRRVRQRLEVVRRRRHDHRGPADARPAGGPVADQAAGARVPQAQDQLQDRRQVRLGSSRPTPASP